MDTNKDVLEKVDENKHILNAIWQRKNRWTGHVLRHGGLLHEIIKEKLKGKPTRGRRRLQMLHDMTKGDGYATLK